jgi:hypothetical protein
MLSAVLAAVQKWKVHLTHHGLDIGAGERRTNIRYSDDLMVYVLIILNCGGHSPNDWKVPVSYPQLTLPTICSD